MTHPMLRRAFAFVALLATAATSLADVVQEGAVQVNAGVVEVGYTLGDGSLWITSPSTLASSTLRVATASGGPTIAGNLFIHGGALDISQTATVGNGGRARLEVTDGGVLSAWRLTLAAANFASPLASQATMILRGAGAKAEVDQTLTLGEYGFAETFISDGALLQSGALSSSYAAVLASRTGSVSNLTLDGPDTAWRHGGTIVVGDLGTATLRAAGGAEITSAGAVLGDNAEGASLSFGTAELTGPSTRWITSSLTIGDRGVGEVRVLDGALLEVTNTQQFTTVLGNQSGSFGRLVVSGTGTRWIDARAVTIGGSGSGELWIEDGALVVNAGAVLAQSSNGGAGLAVVRGAQTRWQAGGLVVGQEGPAQLRIEEGATVVAAGVQAAPRTGTSGRITLDAGTFAVAGSQSFENRGVVEGDGLLSIPYFNNVQSGVVKVGAGQRLRLTGQLNSPQSGRIEIIGGELEVGGTLTNGSASRLVAEGGTLRLAGSGVFINTGLATFVGAGNRVIGNTANNGSITATGNSELTFHGDVQNSSAMKASAGATVTVLGAFSGNGVTGPGDVFLEGPVAPGASPGVMSFGGNVALGELSELVVEAAGPAPGADYDQLLVAGELQLGGALSLHALAELPAAATLTIAAAGELAGTFSSVPALGDHLGYGVRFNGVAYDYAADVVTVSLLPTAPSDFNLDGAVDGADFLVWQQQLGAAAVPAGSGADGNGDGTVDAADLALWRQALAPSAPTLAAVPEPGASPLLLAALLGLSARCGPRRGALRL